MNFRRLAILLILPVTSEPHGHCQRKRDHFKVTTDAPKGATIRPAEHGTTYLVSGLAEEDESLPDRSTGPVAGVTYYTGTDFGLRVPEATPWSAVVDELAPVVICVEVTPADHTGATRMEIRSVDAATDTVVDSVTLERR